MALDRFLYWREQRPTISELKRIIEDYLGDALEGKVEYVEFTSRFYMQLKGKISFPFKRLEDAPAWPNEDRERAIEVFVHGRKGIDVITRQADEYTNVVAKGLWELLRRYYAAKTEDEECEPEKPESIVEGLKTTRLIERLREAAQHAEYPQGDPPVCHEADEFIRRLRG